MYVLKRHAGSNLHSGRFTFVILHWGPFSQTSSSETEKIFNKITSDGMESRAPRDAIEKFYASRSHPVE